jgi:hypothetical protein
MTTPQHPHNPMLDRLLGPTGYQVSCEECFDLLDQYVELEIEGSDVDRRLPGMRTHLEACPACREDHDSLRELVARGR